MVAFNRSIYKFAKNDVVKRELYEKLIGKYYFKPEIVLSETPNEYNMTLHSDAKFDFYLMMKKFDKTKKNNDIYVKYEDNINTIKNFVNDIFGCNYDLAIKHKFENPFESNEDMLQSLCFVDQITKYFEFDFNFNKEYTFGVEKHENVCLFSCSKENISNCAYYPLFDIDDGFTDLFGNKNNVYVLNCHFNKWKNNNYQGEIFDN
jgi:hypothetical protein